MELHERVSKLEDDMNELKQANQTLLKALKNKMQNQTPQPHNDDRKHKSEQFLKSGNVIMNFMKVHPEIKEATEARDLLLELGVGSVEDLQIVNQFDFGSNVNNELLETIKRKLRA